MSKFRDKIQQSPATGWGIVAVIALLAAFLIYSRMSRDLLSGPDSVYFYNLTTKEVVVEANATLSPETYSNGEVLVKAMITSCSDCSDIPTREIAYLTKYNDAARAVRVEFPRNPIPMEHVPTMTADDAELISTPELAEAGTWYPQQSSQGSKLANAIVEPCESTGEPRKFCYP